MSNGFILNNKAVFGKICLMPESLCGSHPQGGK